MGKGKKEFNVGNPQNQIAELQQKVSKYQIGEKGYSFHDIRELKPTFAFDYLSMDGTSLCFNWGKLEIKDYTGFLNCLKTLSSKTYKELKEVPNYRFHAIDFDDKKVTITRDEFKSILTAKPQMLKDEELPNLYQFDLNYIREARACGFLFKGVFYIVWFDRNHQIYPQTK